MQLLLAYLPNLARMIVGFYFAFYGFWNIYHWTPIITAMNRDKIPHPYLILPVGILWQFIFGFMIMIDVYAKLAAALLIPFVLLAIIVFHPFWRYQGDLKTLNFASFCSNGLLGIASLLFIIGPLPNFSALLI